MTAVNMPIAQLQQLLSEYQGLKSSIAVGQQALNNVITSGTTLFNDANYAATFGNIAGYTAYLTACQAAINALFAAWPAEPVVQWPVGS